MRLVHHVRVNGAHIIVIIDGYTLWHVNYVSLLSLPHCAAARVLVT